MEIIKNLDGKYVNKRNGKIELTSSFSKATQFITGTADKFINNQIPKKNRQNYQIEQVGTKKTEKDEEVKVTYQTDVIKIVQQNLHSLESQLKPLKDYLNKQLVYNEDCICDILHHIGNENTNLNVCQLAKVAKQLQKYERYHTATKKELQRVKNILDKSTELIEIANTFQYSEYKPRVIQSLEDVLKEKK